MSRNNNPVPSLFAQPGYSPHTSSTSWHSSGVSQAAVAFFFLLVAFSACAQETSSPKAGPQSSSIHGAVTTMQDNTPSGVAGISVKLAGDPLHGTPLSADTDEHGAYVFPNLEPGSYAISITLQGFKSI